VNVELGQRVRATINAAVRGQVHEGVTIEGTVAVLIPPRDPRMALVTVRPGASFLVPLALLREPESKEES
jgi:hypothetical protein